MVPLSTFFPGARGIPHSHSVVVFLFVLVSQSMDTFNKGDACILHILCERAGGCDNSCLVRAVFGRAQDRQWCGLIPWVAALSLKRSTLETFMSQTHTSNSLLSDLQQAAFSTWDELSPLQLALAIQATPPLWAAWRDHVASSTSFEPSKACDLVSSILLPDGFGLPFLIDRLGQHSGSVRCFLPDGDGRLYVKSKSESLMVEEWLAQQDFSKYLVDVPLSDELINIHAKCCPLTLYFHCVDLHRVIQLAAAQLLQVPTYTTPNLLPLGFFNYVPPGDIKIGTAPHRDGDGTLFSLHTALVSPSSGVNQVSLFYPPSQPVLFSSWLESFGWHKNKSSGLVYEHSFKVPPLSTVRNHSNLQLSMLISCCLRHGTQTFQASLRQWAATLLISTSVSLQQ